MENETLTIEQIFDLELTLEELEKNIPIHLSNSEEIEDLSIIVKLESKLNLSREIQRMADEIIQNEKSVHLDD